MLDAGTLIEHSGIDLTTGTKDIDTESPPRTTPFPEECVERLGMLEPDASPLQIDETNQNAESRREQRLQYEVVRSSEEANDTIAVPTMRPSSSSSVSSSRSSASSLPTTPSSVSPSSSKSLDIVVSPDHSGVVVEEAADEEHTFAVGQHNDVTASPRASFDLLEDTETSTAPATPSSSTSSLPQVTINTPTSTSAINIQATSIDHESYGLLSLLRPRTDSGHNLSVRFAPLPELEPRKRKSAIPLGMAARSQLARKRRVHQEDDEDQDPYRPRLYARVDVHAERSSVEVDNAELRLLKKKMLEKLRKEDEEELVEDSLVVLAKKMGSAGKHLWKKMMAQKANREDINSPHEPRATPSGVTAGKPASSTVDPAGLPPLLEEEEKIHRLNEKPVVRNRDKLQFRNPQAPTLST